MDTEQAILVIREYNQKKGKGWTNGIPSDFKQKLIAAYRQVYENNASTYIKQIKEKK